MSLGRLRRLGRDRSGVTIVEFAMILPALCVLLLGTFELGYRSYAASVVQGALHDAARMATVGGVEMEAIDARVRDRLSNFAQQGTVDIQVDSYAEFSGVGIPEEITTDTVPLGEYNEGDCWIDTNESGEWEADGGSAGVGNSEDVVRYQVSLTVKEIVPISSLLADYGWTEFNTISGNTVLRNQPYGSRPAPVTEPTCPDDEDGEEED